MRKIIDAADLFKPHIFERGEVISYTDAITITHQSVDLISAVVEGTDDYDVQIMMQNGDIIDMSCSCPYADSGENCKHMAAVLIHCFEYLNDTPEEDEESIHLHTEALTRDQYSVQTEELEKLIRQEAYDDIVAFLISEMLRDSEIKKSFLARFSPRQITVKDMVADFKLICNFYMGRKRFIDYSHASRFFAELDGYLDRVNSLIENGLLLQAAQVIAGITRGFDDLTLDDSDGGTTDFYMRVIELLNFLLSCEDEETNDFVLDWISQAIADEDNWYLSEMLQPVWESQFDESELIEKKIEQIMGQLGLLISQPEKKVEDYQFISNLITLAELRLQRGDGVGAVESMLAPFRCSCRILIWLVNLAESNGNQEKEYELLQDGLALAQKKHHLGMINEFGVKLCSFYQRTNQIERYKFTLKNLLLSNQHHLEYYYEYKALFGQEEWMLERETIIGKFENQYNNEIKEVTYRDNFPSSTILLPFEDINPDKLKILSYTTYEKLDSIDLDLENVEGKLEQLTDFGDLSIKVDEVSEHRYSLDILFKSDKITPVDMKLVSEGEVLDYKNYSIGGRENSEGNVEGNFIRVNQSFEINSLNDKYTLEIWGHKDNKTNIEIPIN